MVAFRELVEDLIRPSPTLLAPDRQREARLLSAMLLVLIVIGSLVQVVIYWSAPVGRRPGIALGGVIAFLSLGAMYLISRTRHYRSAAMLTAVIFAGLTLAIASQSPDRYVILNYLVVPVVFCSMFISLAATLAIATLNWGAIVLFVLLEQPTTVDTLLSPLTFYALISGLLLMAAAHRDRLEQDRQWRLAEREIRFRTMTEKALVGVYIIQDGLFRYVNPALAHIFGYQPEDIIDRLAPQDLAAPEDVHRVREQLRSRLEGEVDVAHYFLDGIRQDGRRIKCEVMGRRADYHGRPAIVGTLLDITERKQIEEAEREQRALAEALRDTATVLNSTLDLDQVLSRILDNVGRVVPHDGANIMLLRDGYAHVVRCQGYYVVNGFADAVMDLSFPIENTVNFRRMKQSGKPYVVADTNDYPGWLKMKETAWVRSYVGAPIIHNGEVIGFLNVDSKTAGFFNERHAERLQNFSDQVAIALQNAQHYQQLEHYSEILEQAVHARTAELQRTLEQLAVTLNNSPDAILLLRADGTISNCNPAFYELFGYTEEEALNRSPDFVTTGENKSILRSTLAEVIEEGRRRRLELRGTRKDGRLLDVDLAIAPVRDGDAVEGAVCSLRDISDLKEVERMKDAFVSNVSHELRTPVTILKLYQDLLERNPHKYETYLDRLGREIDRLNVIIEDLLRLSRLERGQVDVRAEQVDLNQLVGQYVRDRLPLSQEKDIRLIWRPMEGVAQALADAGLLEQVLNVLLTNALAYTPAGGEVRVTVCEEQHDGQVWVGCRVEDSGPGITSEEQTRIFERFFRGVAGEHSREPGTGLGLAIAREIVDRHGGRIEVESEVNEGASFTVWLPGAAYRSQETSAARCS